MAGGVKIISIAGRPRTSLRILTIVYNKIKKRLKKEKYCEPQENRNKQKQNENRINKKMKKIKIS